MNRVLHFSCAVLLLWAVNAQAQLYKWIGPDGKVTYSDEAPPASAKHIETKAVTSDSTPGIDLPFELAQAVKSHPVTLYTTGDCAPCDDGRKLLSGRGIPFREKTVNSSEDMAHVRQVGGDGQVPFLTIGHSSERGFQADAWHRALSAAGYPESNKLPKNYRSLPAEAAATASKPDTAKQVGTERSEERMDRTPATALPPAVGNAPPGFRF